MKHYVYKILNQETNQYYIGVRSNKNPEKDSYFGSSTIWNKNYIRDNKSILSKKILEVFNTRELANSREMELIKENINDILCINLHIPGSKFFNKFKVPCPEHLKTYFAELYKGEGNPFYGKKHSKETKDRISKANKGKLSGENNPFFGKKHSEEVIDLISRKTSGKNNHKSKAIKVIDVNTKEVFIYDSINIASRNIDGSVTCIIKAIKKGNVFKKKYIIEYADNS